ncbi:MAG: FxLYD domain-containing protein [Acidobacteriota bacterium]
MNAPPSPRRVLVALLLTAAWIAPQTATADWLVTRDGSQIETEGPWEQKGRLVVFTDAEGQLRSLRASDVDFEASAEATEAALRPPEAPVEVNVEEPPPRSVLVLTDADVNQVDPEDLLAEAEGDTEAAPSAAANALVVSNWDQLSQPEGGLLVSGTLVNNASYLATQISVEVSVYDSEGVLVGELPARLSSDSLSPEESLTFRTIFPELVGVANATFRITNRGFETTPDSNPDSDEFGDETGEATEVALPQTPVV